MKNEMKKLSLTKKMSKVVKMKKVQQVTTLRTQQQKRTDRVTELLVEEERVTGIIQHVHQKVQQAVESTRLTTSEHINSNLVENSIKKKEKLQEETAQIVKIFQDYQSKVITTEVLD